MVLPSAGTRKRRSRRGNKDILVVIAVVVIAVGLAWLITLSLLGRSISSDSTPSAPISPADLIKNKGGGGGKSQDIHSLIERGEMHLSSKHFQATNRPYLIYGTAWKEEQTADLVFQAVHAGFRFIDTACQPKHYNEAGVGKGWKMAADQLGLDREDLFIQTKFTSVDGQDPNNIPYDANAKLEEQVKQSVQASLKNLQTTYIDSLVLHSPMKTHDETLRVWQTMEGLVHEGKVRQLGISNCYDAAKFKRLYGEAKIKPHVLQNRFYQDSGFDIELRTICKSVGMLYQSFWTLSANRNALASPDWKAMASEKGLTPQTLMYAYMMTLGHTPLSGTKDPNHMEQDVDLVLRFQRGEEILSEKEMDKLSSLLGIR